MNNIKSMIIFLRNQLTINGSMASHGILFLFFGLILMGVKHTGETPFMEIIPPPPNSFSMFFRTVVSILLLIFIIIFMWIWQKYKLAKFLKRYLRLFIILIVCLLLFFALWLIPPVPTLFYKILGKIVFAISVIFMIALFWKWFANKLTKLLEGQFQYLYWVVFWFVYIIGWFKGVASIPVESVAWPFYIGFFWLLIISVLMFRAIGRLAKH